MRHLKGAVWTERLLLVLIVASVAGTLNLVMAVHRRVRAIEADRTRPKVAAPDVKPPRPVVVAAPRPVPAPPRSPVPAPPPPPAKPAEDPTAAILARIDRAIAREVEAAKDADRRAEAHEAAIRRSEAESQRWKRREMLVRQQIAVLDRRAEKAETEVAALDAERDVLERERDLLKAATAKASQKTGYAILPYKGPNGTWRRPIVLECTGDTVKLQPSGRTFTALELSPLIHPRHSPIVLAIASEMLHIQRSRTPDGAPAVPYLVFLVRPDGIRPYYRLRERLEPLGIAFGYELIEQELAVNIPNLDDLTTWDGTVPLDSPELAALEESRRRIAATQDQEQTQDAADRSPGWPPADRTAANDPNAAQTPAPANWPPTGANEKPGNSAGRWPDLARNGANEKPGNSAGRWPDLTSGGAPPPLSREAPSPDGTRPPEIDVNAALERGKRAALGRPGASNGSESSPDDFVWPSHGGTANASGSASPRGNSRGQGSGDSQDSGNFGAVASLTPYGSNASRARPGGAAASGDLGSAFGSGQPAGAAAAGDLRSGSPPAATHGAGNTASPRDVGSGTGSAARPGPASGTSTGSDSQGPGSGQPLRGQSGPVDLSPGRFGVGIRRGTGSTGNTASRGIGSAFGGSATGTGTGTGSASDRSNARGTGAAGGDPLPDLEPAQDGAAQPTNTAAANRPRPTATFGPDPSGGPANAPPSAGPDAPPIAGSSAPPIAGSNAPALGGRSEAPATAGSNAPAPDPGFASYAGGPPSGMPQPAGAGAGAGPSAPATAGRGPMTGGTSPPASAGMNQPPPLVAAGAGPQPQQGTADPAELPPDASGDLAGGGSGNSGSGSGATGAASGTGGASSSNRAGSSPSSAMQGTAGANWGTPAPTPPSANNLPQGNWSAAQGNPPPQGRWSAAQGNPPPPINGATPPGSGSLASSLPPELANALSGLASGSSNSSSTNASGSTSTSASSSSSSSASSSASAGGSWGNVSPPPPQDSSNASPGLSLPSFSMSPDPESEPDSRKPLAQPPIDYQRKPGQIDVPFEIVAVCRRDDILLHPGGYRITRQSLQSRAAGGTKNEDMLKRELLAIVRKRAQVDPLIRPRPQIKFLVESGGGTTFWTAQQQLIFSNLNWPMSMQVAGPQTTLLPNDQEVTR